LSLGVGWTFPVPLVSTFDARPLAVFCASGGGGDTSAGAGIDFPSGAGGSAGAALGIVIVSSDALALGAGEVDDGGSFFSHAASDDDASSASAVTAAPPRRMRSSGPEGSIEVRTAPSVQRRGGRDNANAARDRGASARGQGEGRRAGVAGGGVHRRAPGASRAARLPPSRKRV
jgi:hypothetical protein